VDLKRLTKTSKGLSRSFNAFLSKLPGRSHLVIPDAHAMPGLDNRRFDWLGQFIIDTKPDVIVCIGDFFDMAALCKYDKGTTEAEGRRIQTLPINIIQACHLHRDCRYSNLRGFYVYGDGTSAIWCGSLAGRKKQAS
jgi:hypothetical protein